MIEIYITIAILLTAWGFMTYQFVQRHRLTHSQSGHGEKN